MYDREVEVPRLLAGVPEHPACAGRVRELAEALSQHYGARFDRQMMALYRDGRDSVAWHGDKLGAMRSNALVGVLSLGGRRRFALRPAGGGRSRVWSVGEGDLVVMGGTCQATWEHCVPKVREAAPRIALMFRHSVPLCAGKPSDVGHSGRLGYAAGGGENGASRRRS
jgi:alkylated DNA repair dioxygenase AlkB